MHTLRHHMMQAAQVLVIFAVIGAGLVALSHQVTADKIAANERAAMLASLSEIVPSHLHDNDLFNDTMQVQHPSLLGTADTITVYRARQGSQPIAAVFNAVAPQGYNGDIRLLIGIRYDGTLLGVRVVTHQETPGLGDAIEARRSDWIHQFTGKSLHQPVTSGWAVKRDGGDFDQFTGATITPRAVVQAVYNALQFFQRQRDTLFATNSLLLQEDMSHTGTASYEH